MDFRVRSEDAIFIRELDAMRPTGKKIYGAGFILSQKATEDRISADKIVAERAAAHRWELSEREKALFLNLGGGNGA